MMRVAANQRFDAAVFDMDGLLLDSERPHGEEHFTAWFGASSELTSK